jgi:hypothetical protein
MTINLTEVIIGLVIAAPVVTWFWYASFKSDRKAAKVQQDNFTDKSWHADRARVYRNGVIAEVYENLTVREKVWTYGTSANTDTQFDGKTRGERRQEG